MTNKVEHPDALRHRNISFLKSGIRIVGYVLLIFAVPDNLFTYMAIASWVLIVSELIGIYEELV